MKKSTVILFALSLTLIGFFTFTSCGDDPSSERAEDKMEEAADAVGDAMVAEKNDLKGEINEATANIDRRLEKLNNDMKDATAEAKAEMQEEANQLEAKRKQLAQDLENFGDKTGAEWDQFKSNVRETMKDLGKDDNM
jgi:peptidoglycan hydrolase CwlO-like protein